MDFPLPIPPELREAVPPRTGVLVALSGGVDSSVAVALLAHLGCDVATVTFKNFCYGEAGTDERACCSREAIEEAAAVARRFGVRHWVSDVSGRFRDEVIEPFIAEYAAGRTPNPCQICNSRVRFPGLASRADQLGLARIATGHYALVDRDASGARLRRGRDPDKDQSYFLYGIGQAVLERCVFPLGWYSKQDVRTAARTLGLAAADKAESQDICFVPQRDRTFLFTDPATRSPGEIVDRQGRVLGRHRGLVHYTVGQRHGLGVSAAFPLYVLALDRESNRLVVGREDELAVRRVMCDRVVATSTELVPCGPPHAARADGPWRARIRHRHAGALVAAWRWQAERLEVELAEPARGVAPGQSLVLYRDDVVMGGGRIVATA